MKNKIKTAIAYMKGTDISILKQKRHIDQYCVKNDTAIVKEFKEKSNEPSLLPKLMRYANKRKMVDFLLVSSWDSFARLDRVVKHFTGLDIKIQAIKQPFPFDSPLKLEEINTRIFESKCENERVRQRTKVGMLAARKEGRWVSRAPFGYRSINANGLKKLEIELWERAVIENIFDFRINYKFTMPQIREAILDGWGLNKPVKFFQRVLSNPVYKGEIILPASEVQSKRTVKGQHEAIISHEIFQKAQDMRNKRK